MGILFTIWLIGFAVCLAAMFYMFYRSGRVSLHEILESLPLCAASWVTIICEALVNNYTDVEIWSRDK